MVVLRRRKGRLQRIRDAAEMRKIKVSIGDPLHPSFYDADGTLKSSLEIRKQSISSKSEGKEYKV